MISDKVLATFLAPETVDPALAALAIRDATASLGREFGRYFGEPAQTNEIHNGGRDTIWLYDDPIAGEDVTVETRSRPGQAWEAVDAADYSVDENALVHSICWPRGLHNVRVTYMRGYEEDAGPPELMALVRKMVMANLEEIGVREGAMISETIGDYSYKLAESPSWDPTGVEGYLAAAKRWRRRRL